MCYPRLPSIFPLYCSSAVMISIVSDVQKASGSAAVSQEVGSKGKNGKLLVTGIAVASEYYTCQL